MPKPYPKEFRENAVRAVCERDADMPIDQIARDFGIHPTTLHSWLQAAEVSEGPRRAAQPDVLQENRQLKRHNRLLEMENAVLRRAAAYLAQSALPGNGATRR